ncbi:sec-independent translocase [Zafaria cholistanensis]|uniref:sec-independent translocase n=1 Tax=Zafaria cholistanensis TaxID=1682741 RepID=UPI0012308049|nr:sec-independent translocase [Zafaria cholistanensis]
MFGINGGEFLVLAVLAVLILGPDKLPAYAQQLARLVKEVRRMAAGAKEQLREEVGDEIADIDWRKLDPRQYDPRKIIKEALLDDFDDAVSAAKESPQPAVAPRVPARRQAERQLEPGEAPPFDSEAT